MLFAERIYRRTLAGQRAWQSPHSGLPAHYRRILGMVLDETHPDSLRAVLRCYTARQLFDWLDELDTLGLLESFPATDQHDLDFTAHLA